MLQRHPVLNKDLPDLRFRFLHHFRQTLDRIAIHIKAYDIFNLFFLLSTRFSADRFPGVFSHRINSSISARISFLRSVNSMSLLCLKYS